MRTLRRRLQAIVVLCVVPAIVSACYRAYDADARVLTQTRNRVRSAQAAFEAQLEEDRNANRLGAEFLASDGEVRHALGGHDPQELQQATETLGHLYSGGTVVVLADSHGTVLASSDRGHAPRALDSPELSPLHKGKETEGLVPVTTSSGVAGWAYTVAVPVLSEGKPVGEIALLTPLDGAYLDRVKKKAGAALALKINDQLIAHGSDNPAPDIEAHGGGVVAVKQSGRNYSLATFLPSALQAHNREVEVTASMDITRLRANTYAALAESLGVLGLALLVAIFLSNRVAQGINGAVQRLGRAAEDVGAGKYQPVTGVDSPEELKSLAGNFNKMVAGLQLAQEERAKHEAARAEHERLKTMFGKYVTKQVMEHLVADDPQLGEGKMVSVTVLFSDIRGFTTISEHMEPRELLSFLNEYFTGMVDTVLRNDGVVDKYIGDSIMAVFGAPTSGPEDALHAVRTALQMKGALKLLNQRFLAQGRPELRIGIGIHTGNVVAGPMGHKERMEYAVIGDAVNLASRLESMTKEMGVDVLISENTYQAIKDQIDAEPLRKIKVKGREQEVMVYRLVGMTGEIPGVPGNPQIPPAA